MWNWCVDSRMEFMGLVDDLLQDPDVQSMANYKQHSKGYSCLDHSVYVAYISFLVCRRLNLDYVSAARAGLLHDFSLKDWETDEMGVERLWKHPHMALENAENKYDLSDKEKDIIVKHMWPLTRPLPKYKESFVISLVDKFCAVIEMCRLHRVFGVRKHLKSAAGAV